MIALFPIFAQALFTYSAWPKLHTIWRRGKSDQHSIQAVSINAVAQGIMTAWAMHNGDPFATLAFWVAFLLALVTVGFVIWYRVFPRQEA